MTFCIFYFFFFTLFKIYSHKIQLSVILSISVINQNGICLFLELISGKGIRNYFENVIHGIIFDCFQIEIIEGKQDEPVVLNALSPQTYDYVGYKFCYKIFFLKTRSE